MKSQYVLPVIIVAIGVLLAGGIFLLSRAPAGTNTGTAQKTRAVDATDHILGNPNAPVKIIEYADLECPYCKAFQKTMDQVMNVYGSSGKVAWVFRNFPLGQIHSKAPQEAQAAECAADQGGNDAFFKFVDHLYDITPSENGLDLSTLPDIAGAVGLNVDQFKQCLASNKYAQKVQNDYNEAIAEGLQGTPHIVIMTSGGDTLELDGNQPYSAMKTAIDQVLAALGQSVTASSTAATTTAQ